MDRFGAKSPRSIIAWYRELPTDERAPKKLNGAMIAWALTADGVAEGATENHGNYLLKKILNDPDPGRALKDCGISNHERRKLLEDLIKTSETDEARAPSRLS
jgi:hypothetical protein